MFQANDIREVSVEGTKRVGQRGVRTRSPRFKSDDPRIGGGLSSPTGWTVEDGVPMYTFQTPPGLKIGFGGGPLVGDVPLQLLFWGDFWKTAQNPSAADILNAVNNIVNSLYLSELKQYGFNSITNVAATIVSSPPPPPGTYTVTMSGTWYGR